MSNTPRPGRRGTRPLTALAVALLLPASVALGQSRAPNGPLRTPPVSIAAPGDALSVTLDPAALAFLPGWSLRYLHVDAPPGSSTVRTGDAVYAAAPLPLGLAIGGALESIRPDGGGDAGRGSLALAWGTADTFALGAAFRFLRSRAPDVGNVNALDLSMALRPSPSFALSLVATDLTGPVGLATFANGEPVPANVQLAVAFRPTGDHALTLDLAGQIDTDGAIGARAAIDVRLPRVGRLLASVEADRLDGSDPVVAVLAGLAVNWGALGAGGGVVFGDVRGGADAGWYATASASGARRGGLPTGRWVADLRVPGLGPRGAVGLLASLDALTRERDLAGVLLRMRGGAGLAVAQEIRSAIARLEAAGVRVACHFEAATGSAWYACGTASARFVDPAGGVRLVGPAAETLLLGEALDRLGVGADFLRIGRYKSAVELYENRASTEPARAQRRAFVDAARARLVADLAGDLDVDEERAAALVDRGPYVAPEAREAGLVDAVVDERELDGPLADALGGRYQRRERPPRRAPARWGRRGRVAVVVIDGQIVDGENVDVPLLDLHLSGGDTVVDAIEGAAADPSVGAIVLRVDSPGGSALASDRIWRAVRRARRRKPVVASLGAVAASGGYYVASAADTIYADPTTLTGSIGIFFGKVDVAGLADRLGVTVEETSGGARAGYDSIWRPFTADERRMLVGKIRHFYRLFLDRVAEGRGLAPAAVDAVGRGRIWTGEAARAHGLVDALGGLTEALIEARRRSDLPDDAPLVVRPRRPSGLLDYVLGAVGEAGEAPVDAGAAGLGALRALDPGLLPLVERGLGLARTAPETPLALLPLVDTPAAAISAGSPR